ncbi:MAG: site-specific integrase, partial [Marinomonas sp.]
MIAPGLTDARERWLDELSGVGGRAEKTIEAYRADLQSFLAFLQNYEGQTLGLGQIAKLTTRTMRAWMAHERGRGLSARSLARSLSAVKSFVAWQAEKEGFDPTAVLATRSPKFQKKLPRPLSENAARNIIDTVELQSPTDWVGLRDMAVVTLLYGCGLRISEAIGLIGQELPLGDSLRILGKGKKERVVPVIPAARRAVQAYVDACPFEITANEPIFRGVRGGALNPRIVQKVMEKTRNQ